MNWATHLIAFIFGIYAGILFALWVVDVKFDAISKPLDKPPKE
jgi:hypothetical protein